MRADFRLVAGLLGVVLALLLAFGGSNASAQSNPDAGCATGNLTHDYNCPIGPTYLVPGLTDLNGWHDPSHYTNILTGDLTGDKQDELVVRGIGGIQVYVFDRTRGQWTQLKVNQILADSQGWSQRSYYETIRLGDIDGDGRAELVARSAQGIIVFKFTRGTGTASDSGTWTQITTSGPMSDNSKDCFSNGYCFGFDPSYYSTIQLAPIGSQNGPAGSNPTMQLIGRGGDGLEFYKWNGTGWDQLTTLPDLSDSLGWRAPQYYTSIMAWDEKTLIVRYSDGLRVYQYTKGGAGSWKLLPGNRPFPDPQPQSSYSTLQLFHGAGPKGGPAVSGPVVLRRGTAGAQLWNWNGTSWTPLLSGSLPFSNTAGFTQPYYYGTIQAADINGDGRDEILARGAGGMLALRLASDGKSWSNPISVGSPALADNPWTDPAYYTTIKTVKLDPSSPARSLIARGPNGIRTWYFNPSTKTFGRYQSYGLPTVDKTAYNALSADLGIDADGLRQFYADPAATPASSDQLRNYATQLATNCTGPSTGYPVVYTICTPSAGALKKNVTPAVWTATKNQLIKELSFAADVVDYFGSLRTIQSQLFHDQNNNFWSITDDLKLAQAENVSAKVDYETLFEGIFDVLGQIPEAGELFEVTGAALGIADSASNTLNGPTTFDHTVAEAQQHITLIQSDAANAIGDHLHYVLGDYGLMSTIGSLSHMGTWKLDGAAAQSAGRQGFTKWAYQQFLPALWDHWQVFGCAKSAGCAQPGPEMSKYDLHTSGGYTQVDFEGLVPRQRPCGTVECQWLSLESQNFGDTFHAVNDPISPRCKYDPAQAGYTWNFDCSLGVPLTEMLSPAWGFRFFSCQVNPAYGPDCNHIQPSDSAVMDGDAQGLGTNHGKVDLAIVAPLKTDLDLRQGSVTLGRLLHEGGGALELVKRSNGRDLPARPLRLARGAKRHSARFETPRGTSPRVRGTISVLVRKVTVRAGKKRAVRYLRTLKVGLHVDRATLNAPRGCQGMSTTHLGVRLLVRARGGRRAQVLGSAPWTCPKGGRMSYRAPRARARVDLPRAAVRRGVAPIRLRCQSLGRFSCVGTLVLRVRLGGGRQVVAGRGRFTIGTGRTATVRVRLTTASRRALAANRGRLAVTAKVNTHHPSGLALGSSRRLVLAGR